MEPHEEAILFVLYNIFFLLLDWQLRESFPGWKFSFKVGLEPQHNHFIIKCHFEMLTHLFSLLLN